MTDKPIVLTHGEPASIAPEITGKAWLQLRDQPDCAFFVLGDANDLMQRNIIEGAAVPVIPIDALDQVAETFPQALPVLHRPLAIPSRAGWIDTQNSGFVIDVITEAALMCMQGDCSAMVTNPINKDALYSAGFRHQGHTDFLAALAQAQGIDTTEVMMLTAADLRAVPITVHIPLKDVARLLTAEMILSQARIVNEALQVKFGIIDPRLAFTGLNPHAGENGAMGDEEKTIIIPALEILRSEGLRVSGPLPADSAFHAEARATYDAIMCMYHDQALIPVKTLDFHGGTNVTLGLPFIRTSPDHGTALNIAGRGVARADSLITAIRQAAEMAKYR